MCDDRFNIKQFVIIVLITSIWINVSEVFRFFVFVMPMIQSFWEGRSGVAEMNFQIFGIWGLWDTLLTSVLVFTVWLFTRVFGDSMKSIVLSSTIVWATVFVVFWVATANMGLSSWSILQVALPLSWLEMIVGGWISTKLYQSKRWA